MTAPRPGWSLARVRAALARRRHGPYPQLERLELLLEGQAGRLDLTRRRLEELSGRLDRLDSRQAELARVRDDLRDALRALAAKEPENRAELAAVRDAADYAAAWREERPLVSVAVPTVGRPELTSRALPAILAQSHREIEVIVVGDGAPAETEAAVAALGDPRVRYLDLGPRQPWTDDPARLWLVGATRARNAALGEVRGRWIAEFDDDDAPRPRCLESLLERAREADAEAVYGQVRQHRAGGDPVDFCAFPPRLGRFSWAAGMYHAGLRFFGRELLAADLGLPGDWWLAERMLRAGVRFAMRDEVLCDAYASERERSAREGRLPWAEPGETG